MLREQRLLLLLAALASWTSMLEARELSARDDLLATLNARCLNDLTGLQLEDPQFILVKVEPPMLSMFCACADKGMKGDPWLDRIAQLPPEERDERSKPATLLRQSYINHGLECLPKRTPEAVGATGSVPDRSVESLRQAFSRQAPKISAAYQRELLSRPDLSGKVVFKILIAPSGTVEDASIQSSTLGHRRFEQELLGLIRETDFGAMNVKATTITYPVDFVPK